MLHGKGAAHFDMNEQDVIALYKVLMYKPPGYLLPKLVREIAGKCHKIPLNRNKLGYMENLGFKGK
ncbi:hypothetical protein BKE30_08160 [Alkanindiges hydrocarboniclasticus]|jgi:L-lysine 2,3-aminomutase|uniref:Uncharacterized protein n=2 Tax=Alkanindiges hydrocarboniclasticus TaxID=1907941 RepID=A0A1S8CTL6_9GAMM|nr:hypothetical protein BKE30_08160 [Alkanindiges hydrocarboniclasticus]